MDSEIKVMNEIEFYQGFIRLRCLFRTTLHKITDLARVFSFDDDRLLIDKSESASYQSNYGLNYIQKSLTERHLWHKLYDIAVSIKLNRVK